MARTKGRILPFRIPFFRIFYSTTYTTVYFITLCFLVITPASLIYQSIDQRALQYVVMIGGAYFLVATFAIFIYASRLYTNRTIMAAVGKTYVPVEPGEVGKKVRKMIVKQYERSAVVAWESRPRDLLGEILEAERVGILAPETAGLGRNDYTVGREIRIDPEIPPWGDVRHAGWSSPAQGNVGELPNIQFAPVIQELPNLIEAKAVSLAPSDPVDNSTADPQVLEVLQRPSTTGMRDYLTQLAYLGLVNPPEIGEAFLNQYESARFSGLPLSEDEFRSLMSAFAELLAGMTGLQPEIVEQIRIQTGETASLLGSDDTSQSDLMPELPVIRHAPSPLMLNANPGNPIIIRTPSSRDITPQVTRSPMRFPRAQQEASPLGQSKPRVARTTSSASSSLLSDQSDSGSVIRHRSSPENG